MHESTRHLTLRKGLASTTAETSAMIHRTQEFSIPRNVRSRGPFPCLRLIVFKPRISLPQEAGMAIDDTQTRQIIEIILIIFLPVSLVARRCGAEVWSLDVAIRLAMFVLWEPPEKGKSEFCLFLPPPPLRLETQSLPPFTLRLKFSRVT